MAKEKAGSRGRRFLKLCIDSDDGERALKLSDLKMLKGDIEEHWFPDVLNQRKGRPSLVINKTPQFVKQVCNEQRQNSPQIKIIPAGITSNPVISKLLAAIIKNIESQSRASEAYDTAFYNAVSIGEGYFRITTKYSSDDTFDQDIRIEKINNTFSVYLNPNHQRIDGSDARFALISEWITKEDYKARFGKEYKGLDLETGIGDELNSWTEEKKVRIAEYWEIVDVEKEISLLTDGTTVYLDELTDEEKMQYEMTGVTVKKTRSVMVPKVTQYIIDGRDEPVEENEWAGKYIPIVKVTGDETWIEGKRYTSGIIRQARDSQKMYNYWRPLALDTRIPTPDGWTTMGDIDSGARVFDENGKPCNVTGCSPVHIKRDCYRVSFDDGTSIVADSVHPWFVEERGKRTSKTWDWSVKTIPTIELVPGKHFIHTAKPLDLNEADLPVHPYVLGAWLGDGTSLAGVITSGDADINEMRESISSYGYHVGRIRNHPERTGNFTIFDLLPKLRQIGVYNNKHIPEIYLRSSIEQRRLLLQGLMDTDGCISNGQCNFTNINEELISGVSELLRSLGIKAVMLRRAGYMRKFPNGGTYECSSSMVLSFTAYKNEDIFKLARKRERLISRDRKDHYRRTKRHGIVSVVPVDSVPVKCIAVDSASHLFLAGDGMIPTHNTSSTELVALAPKAPFLVTPKQIENHQGMWDRANVDPVPYLLYNESTAAMPQRVQYANSPVGAVSEALGANDDMKEVTGINDASKGRKSNETSGRAILARKSQGDIANFNYIDNMGASVAFGGRILVDLIPKIYDAERIVRIETPEGKTEMVPINQTTDDPLRGISTILNDISVGEYDVEVTTGPNYATQRQEAVQNMTQLIQYAPETGPIIADLIAEMMDSPISDKIAARLKKMLPPQLQEGGPPPIPPELEQQMQQHQEIIQKQQQEIQQLQQDQALKQAEFMQTKELSDSEFQLKVAEMNRQYELEVEQMERKHNLAIADMEQKYALKKYEAELDAQVKHEANMVKAESDAAIAQSKQEKENGMQERQESEKEVAMPNIIINMPSGKKTIKKTETGYEVEES